MKTGVPSLGWVSLNWVLSEDKSSLSGFDVTKLVVQRGSLV